MTVRSFYRDYMLTCQPLSQPDGRFQARVVITSMAGDRTRSQRFLDLEVFNSEEAAIEHARRSGMEWIDINHRER
jgi:hypothetical protein